MAPQPPESALERSPARANRRATFPGFSRALDSSAPRWEFGADECHLNFVLPLAACLTQEPVQLVPTLLEVRRDELSVLRCAPNIDAIVGPSKGDLLTQLHHRELPLGQDHAPLLVHLQAADERLKHLLKRERLVAGDFAGPQGLDPRLKLP